MSDIKNLKTYCENLNELCARNQTVKEVVSREEADRAMAYAKEMPLVQAGDVLLFCSAINLMNTYVKQGNKKTFGYFFKGYVPRLLERLEERPMEGVRFCNQIDGRNALTMVEVCGVQFSFHCVPGTRKRLSDETIPWDGIRKQMCASTLFAMAERNRLLRSSRSVPEAALSAQSGKSPDESLKKQSAQPLSKQEENKPTQKEGTMRKVLARSSCPVSSRASARS